MSACAGDTFHFAEIVRARISEREFLIGAAPHSNAWSLFRESRIVDAGIDWALPLGDDLPRAWRECPRGDWMIQMAEALGVDDALVVQATADCVRDALAQFHPNRDGSEAERYVETVRRHAEEALRMAAAYATIARSVAPERVAEDAGNSHRGMASAACALIAGMAQRPTGYARQEPLTRGPSQCAVAVRDATWELRSSGKPIAPARVAQRIRERIPISALVR